VNLPGIDVAQTHRGAVLADATFVPSASLPVRFRAHIEGRSMLRRRTPVRAYLGAAEILGTLVFETLPDAGDAVDATLHLRRPTTTFPGQTYVVRTLSPKILLGGGTIGTAVTGSEEDDQLPPDVAALAAVVAESELIARTVAELAARANVREERATEILADLAAMGAARRLQKPLAYIDGAAADVLSSHVREILARREAEAPWTLGTTSLVLARELGVDEPFLIRFLAAEAEDGRIGARAGYYTSPGHQPRLSEEQRAFFSRVVPADPAQPFVPVPLDDVLAELRQAKIPGLAQALDTLLETGALVKVGGTVYRGAQIAEIRRRLEAAIRSQGPITMARFRDAVGTSRKYVVPLMEWFDATGVTIRSGDLRTLRQRPAP
jgi:selenocysteine-specific elongation factor